MERRACNLDLLGLTGVTSRTPSTTMDHDVDVEYTNTHPRPCSSIAPSLVTAN